MVRGAWRRNGSRNNTAPTGSPSMRTHAIAAESRLARFTAARAQSASTVSERQLSDLNSAIVDRGGDAPARFFDHVGRQRQRRARG